MRYRIPAQCRALAHAGRQWTPAADGTIELDAAAAEALAPHGLIPVRDPAALPPPNRGGSRDDGRPRDGEGRGNGRGRR